jgi:hypothetical protein
VALFDRAYVDALRAEALAGLAVVTGYCPWFESTWEASRDDPAAIVAAHMLLPLVQGIATQEMRRQSATAGARARMADEARERLRDRVSEIVALCPSGDEDLEPATVRELLESFDAFTTHARACSA